MTFNDNPQCPQCSGKTRRYGTDKLGNQRYHCDFCSKTFITEKKEIRLDRKTVLLCLRLLVEGNSVRSTERIAEVHRDTILHLLNVVGAKCEKVMEEKIVNVPVGYVEADEIWGFVQKKEGHKVTEADLTNPKIGDAYTFVGIEAESKLVLAYQLGRRVVSYSCVAWVSALKSNQIKHFIPQTRRILR